MAPASLAHVPALPAMGVITLLRALFKRPQPHPATLPELTTDYRLDQLPMDDIVRYRAAFGFTGEHVPLTWWYLLAQRAHLATMLDPAFPYRIAGLVHMDNILVAHSRIAPRQPLLVRTVLRLLPPSSSGALRCVLETSGSADGAPIFTCTSTYLVRRGTRSGAKPPETEFLPHGTTVARWQLDAASGRRYARLSGDWNPIHLYAWSARLMGMGAPIIHGMHTLASSCAALENASGRHATHIDCRFRAPVMLGSLVTLRTEDGAGGFLVEAGGQASMTGNCTLRGQV
ncbi:MaoC family dehydratase [Massilia yuzhufengensis]|uniref:MaoC like domain-containing protein n=1 Tax=Massilia yuzhufengensis TaxID=1164594 RepID=A0A1I1NKY8_9BURK|nr:MaoC/PaaZ C-terminal domain-containing protein [Massilia yuzhufengensis]SFC98197.1 MaoC like domain-containing protein [Massilia yuzhufengensis]